MGVYAFTSVPVLHHSRSSMGAIAALIAYVILIIGLFVVMRLVPSSGVLTFAQSVVGVILLQLPALVVILTLVLGLRAMAESLKILAQVAGSLSEESHSRSKE